MFVNIYRQFSFDIVRLNQLDWHSNVCNASGIWRKPPIKSDWNVNGNGNIEQDSRNRISLWIKEKQIGCDVNENGKCHGLNRKMAICLWLCRLGLWYSTSTNILKTDTTILFILLHIEFMLNSRWNDSKFVNFISWRNCWQKSVLIKTLALFHSRFMTKSINLFGNGKKWSLEVGNSLRFLSSSIFLLLLLLVVVVEISEYHAINFVYNKFLRYLLSVLLRSTSVMTYFTWI